MAQYRKELCGELLAVRSRDEPSYTREEDATHDCPYGTIRVGGWGGGLGGSVSRWGSMRGTWCVGVGREEGMGAQAAASVLSTAAPTTPAHTRLRLPTPTFTLQAHHRRIRRYEVLYAVQALAQRWRALQVRREARQQAYEKALGDTMHSAEQAAIQACLDLLRAADSMEVRSGWWVSVVSVWWWWCVQGFGRGWAAAQEAACPAWRRAAPQEGALPLCPRPQPTSTLLHTYAPHSPFPMWQELEDCESKFRLATQQFAPEDALSQLSLEGHPGMVGPRRRVQKSARYALCLRGGLGGWVQGLGLSAAQLAENVEAGYKKHEPTDLQVGGGCFRVDRFSLLGWRHAADKQHC